MKAKMPFLSMLIFSIAIVGAGCANVAETRTALNSAGNSPLQTEPSSETGLISIVPLLASPQSFNGRRIQVIGFVHLEFEGNGIYLSREDFQYGIEKNGLWLSISSADIETFRRANDSYVIVEGTFNSDIKGHVGMWSGSIEKITKFQRWAKPGNSRIR